MSYQFIIIATLIIFFTSFGQILLKKGANTTCHLIFNRYVMFGYLFFFFVLFLSAILMRTIELKYFSIIVGLNYMVTTLLAALIIKENISPKRFFGCVLVATGSILFSW